MNDKTLNVVLRDNENDKVLQLEAVEVMHEFYVDDFRFFVHRDVEDGLKICVSEYSTGQRIAESQESFVDVMSFTMRVIEAIPGQIREQIELFKQGNGVVNNQQ